MIQILPVESKKNLDHITSPYFEGQDHYFRMEMRDGSSVLGSGDIFIKGHAAYLLALDIEDPTSAYIILTAFLGV